MSSLQEQLQSGQVLYPCAYNGVVADVADPKGRHRVRLHVPGIVDAPTMTRWAPPLTAGGGSPGRGGHVVPALGADVCVWFIGGDVERPVYAGGWWGERGGEEEVPEDARGLPPEEAAQVQVLEGVRHRVTLDERPGREQLVLQDKLTGDVVQMDGATGQILVKATAALVLRADGHVSIEGTEITIGGRRVLSSDAAIG